MMRPRTVFVLAFVLGVAYALWRGSRQFRAPRPALAGPTLRAVAPPAPARPAPTALATDGAVSPSGSAGPRRIVTRVHRGAPPALRPAADALLGAGQSDPLPGAELAPAPAEAEPEAAPAEAEPEAAPAEAEPEAAPSLAENADTTASNGPINLNSADLNTLIALPGIGPVLATRIISYRDAHGPFSSVDQLVDIAGIGPANINEFRHLVTV